MKNTQKHTQGPWTANLNGFARDNQNNAQWTAGPLCQCLVIIPNRNTSKETEANAHLIAAAPDLLQVTKDFLLLAALHDWEGAAIDFAKATLAKAEGVK